MDDTCLKYCLTDDERGQFEEQGYLVLDDVLPTALLPELNAAADELVAEYRETLESLKELEEQWGSINGWERLYYIDPWICTSLTFGVTIVILVFKTIH